MVGRSSPREVPTTRRQGRVENDRRLYPSRRRDPPRREPPATRQDTSRCASNPTMHGGSSPVTRSVIHSRLRIPDRGRLAVTTRSSPRCPAVAGRVPGSRAWFPVGPGSADQGDSTCAVAHSRRVGMRAERRLSLQNEGCWRVYSGVGGVASGRCRSAGDLQQKRILSSGWPPSGVSRCDTPVHSRSSH